MHLGTGAILQNIKDQWRIDQFQLNTRSCYKPTDRCKAELPVKWCPMHVIRTAEWLISLPKSVHLDPYLHRQWTI